MKSLLPLARLCELGLGAPAALGQGPTARIGARPPPATTAIANPLLRGGRSASSLAYPFPPSVPALGVPGTSAAGSTRPDTDPPAPVGTESTAVMGAGPYGNRDGELSRTEALCLAIMPPSFEEMDANHDDRLARSGYGQALR